MATILESTRVTVLHEQPTGATVRIVAWFSGTPSIQKCTEAVRGVADGLKLVRTVDAKPMLETLRKLAFDARTIELDFDTSTAYVADLIQ